MGRTEASIFSSQFRLHSQTAASSRSARSTNSFGAKIFSSDPPVEFDLRAALEGEWRILRTLRQDSSACCRLRARPILDLGQVAHVPDIFRQLLLSAWPRLKLNRGDPEIHPGQAVEVRLLDQSEDADRRACTASAT